MYKKSSLLENRIIAVLIVLFFSMSFITMLGIIWMIISTRPQEQKPILPGATATAANTATPAIPTPIPTFTLAPNLAPVARFNSSTQAGMAPLQVSLDASTSLDPEGGPLVFDWDCGNGVTWSGSTAACEYTTSGIYTIRLTVQDDRQGMGQVEATIEAKEPPFLARYVIVFIGDGMGFEHVRAGGVYLNGAEGTLAFESFPYRGEMTTQSLGGEDSETGENGGILVTDSAAAATAMATGVKVRNGVISLAIPGDGRELYTLLEYARDRGLSTGIVTTTTITHATPAGFASHAENRSATDEIAVDMLYQTRPNVLFGGGGNGMTAGGAQEAGYQVVVDLAGFQALQTENFVPDQTFLSGQFGVDYVPYEADGPSGLPQLYQMTGKALDILDNDPDGFFLVVEGGRIDHAAHANSVLRMVGEVAGFSNSVQAALTWAQSHPDTLILVIADHETGGLQLLGTGEAGSSPPVSWTTTSHTGSNVPFYLYGLLPEGIPAVIDNTDIPDILTGGKFPNN